MDKDEVIGRREAKKDVVGFITTPHIVGITIGVFALLMLLMP